MHLFYLICGHRGAATIVARDHSYYSNGLLLFTVIKCSIIRLPVTENSNAVSNALYFNTVIPVSGP